MLRNLTPVHLLILVTVIVVVVGWKRLPDVARSLGRSMRILKSEVEEMKQDGKAPPSAASSDTVKGDTVKDDPASDATPRPAAQPTPSPAAQPTPSQFTDPTAEPIRQETHNQPPA